MSIQYWSQDVILVDLPEQLGKHDELQAVMAALHGSSDCDVVVDFSNVQVVSGAWLTRLQKIQRRVNECGHTLTLCNVPPAIRGVFTIAHIDDLFKFVEDRFAALASPQPAVEGARDSAPGSADFPSVSHDAARDRLRVLLADDHEIVREGLRLLLSDEQDVEVVGEASNGREAVDLADRLEPDVIIMDVSMPLMDGDEATRQIKAQLPQTRVIALTMYDGPETMETMYRVGAENYVLKTAPAEELLAAIRGKGSNSHLNPM
jgi:CheY-like chemotaxis protein/anti-anti-sigma regulatory factor